MNIVRKNIQEPIMKRMVFAAAPIEENTVIILPNGDVECNDILNLGYQGDKNFKKIIVDTTQLINIANIENYNQFLIFTTPEKETIKELFTGNIYYVSDKITKTFGNFDIVFVLEAKNPTEQEETFTSAKFLGQVNQSILDYEPEGYQLLTMQDQISSSIKKPTIQLEWKENNSEIINTEPILGYRQDAFITPLIINDTPLILNANYNIYFFNPIYGYYGYEMLKIGNQHKILIPAEIANNAGNWQIGLKIYDSNTIIVSNIINGTIKNNDLEEIELPLISKDGTLQVDIAEPKILKAAKDFTKDKEFTLNFTGPEVDDILTKGQNQINEIWVFTLEDKSQVTKEVVVNNGSKQS